jgi:hypothetical protein
MKRPMDFSSQKFCNGTSLGQDGSQDRTILGHNTPYQIVTKRPHFPENKTFFFHGQNVTKPKVFHNIHLIAMQ